MAVSEPLSSDLEAQLREACAELRRRWHSGQPAVVEDVLRENPELSHSEAIIELIYCEIALREEFGQPLNRHEWLGRFPHLTDRLNRLMNLHDVVRQEPWLTTSMGWDTDRSRVRSGDPHDMRLDGYELLEEIGRGGMGVVHKARHRQLNRLAAVKFIRDPEFAEPHDTVRLLSEARAAAQLHHPNIVQVFEVGELERRPFLAMEYVAGQSLAERLRTGPLPATQAAELLATIASAIEFAHQHGVIHRDLKPANILLSNCATIQTEVVKIADFGLAKRLDVAEGTLQTGSIVGTPCYMAPEQAVGGSTGPATDIWAMGAVLYECLTGRPPFLGSTALDLLDQVRDQDPVAPSRLVSKLPRDLETICLKCLRREPPRRYESAQALADDLNRFCRGEPVRARPVRAVEQLWKWVKRRPLVAGLVATLLLLSIASGITFAMLWRNAETARANEQAQRELTEKSLAGKTIGISRFAWLSHDLDQARRSLAECPEKYRDREWRYLDRVCNSEVAVLAGEWGIMRLAFSPSGRRIAALCSAGLYPVRVWDIDTRKETARLLQHLNTLDITYPDNDDELSVFCSVGRDTLGYCKPIELRAIDLNKTRTPDGKPIWMRAIRLPVSTNRLVYPTYKHRHKRAALVDAVENVVKFYNMETGEMLWASGDKLGPVLGASISPDGSRVGASNVNGTAWIFDAQDGRTITKIKEQKATVPAFFPDQRRYVVGAHPVGQKPRIVIRDLTTNQDIQRSDVATSAINQIAVSPDGRWIAALASVERVVVLLDGQTGQERLTFRGARDKLNCLAFSPDSRLIAAGTDNVNVHIWRIDPLAD